MCRWMQDATGHRPYSYSHHSETETRLFGKLNSQMSSTIGEPSRDAWTKNLRHVPADCEKNGQMRIEEYPRQSSRKVIAIGLKDNVYP